jgi:hypothetical protein
VYPGIKPCYACHNADTVTLAELAPGRITRHGSLAFLLNHPTARGGAEHVAVGSSVLAGV